MLTEQTVYLSSPVVIGKGVAVLGYDRQYKEAVLDFGTGETTLPWVQRRVWDEGGDDIFTEAQMKQIDEAVRHLK